MATKQSRKKRRSSTEAPDISVVAQTALSAACCSCRNIIAAAGGFDSSGLDPQELIKYLDLTSEEICKADMPGAQSILANQAVTLQFLFTVFTEKAFSADQPRQSESFMHLALRAQSQSMSALEVISKIKQQNFGNAGV